MKRALSGGDVAKCQPGIIRISLEERGESRVGTDSNKGHHQSLILILVSLF